MGYFTHEKAICESDNIGDGTTIWAYAHVHPGAKVGKNCNLYDCVFVENDVVIGDDCTIKCGVQLWDGVHLEERVFVGPNVSFINDPFPRSKGMPTAFSKTVVRRGASIGGNATILPGIVLGENSMIGPGSVVNVSVPANAMVVGNPCRIVRFAETQLHDDILMKHWQDKPSIRLAEEMDISLYRFKNFIDRRGTLTVVDFDFSLPFVPRRMFTIQDVPESHFRGNHAHKQCHQLLICTRGNCRVMVDNGKSRADVLLDSCTVGLHVPPMTWGVQYQFSNDAVLQVLASDPYDAEDYIDCYSDFLARFQGASDTKD